MRPKTLICFFLLSSFAICKALAQDAGCFKDEEGTLTLSVTDKEFCGYDNYIFGEIHDVAAVPAIKLAIIKYLNQTRGIKDIYLEVSQSAALLYNRYLATGDTNYITHPALVYNSSEEGRKFWRALYNYNHGSKNKVTIHGIDFERMEFLKALKILSPQNKTRPSSINCLLLFADTANIEKVNSDTLAAVYERYRKNLQQNETDYKAYYGENYNTVRAILLNENTLLGYAKRNVTMYASLKKQARKRKWVCFVGVKHVDNSAEGMFSRLVANDATIAGKTTSIAMIYKVASSGKTAYRGPASYCHETQAMDFIYEHAGKTCTYSLKKSSWYKESGIEKISDYMLLIK